MNFDNLTNDEQTLICNALLLHRERAMESARYWREEARAGFEPAGTKYAEKQEATARECAEIIYKVHPRGREWLRLYDQGMQSVRETAR